MLVQTLEYLPRPAPSGGGPRRRPTHNTVCRLTDCEGEEIGCGLVWNISTTGVSMLLNVMLPPGFEVDAELANAAGRRVRLRLTVVHFSPLRTGISSWAGSSKRPLQDAEMRPFVT